MVMFFGLTNSPATFQTMMDHVFRDIIDQNDIMIYMDDIFIYAGKTMEEHNTIVWKVLKRLSDNDLYLKLEKCEFGQKEISYLGVIISEGQFRMDPIKVKGIQEWPTPQKVKDIQAFLGFGNFYRRFIKKLLVTIKTAHTAH